MGVERFARKSFGFVVALLLGLAVYFQASGTVELVAAHVLSTPPSATGPRLRRSKAVKTVVRSSATSGDAILSRNPFDSVTGPLDREPITVAVPEAAHHSVDLSDPLRAPECEDVLVNIVTESPDAEWSLAQLKGPGDTDAATRRVGDSVGKMKVAFIGYNAVKSSPAVWLVSDEKICQAFLFSEKSQKPAAEATASAEPAAPAPAAGRAATRRGAPALPSEIADKIQKVSETEFNVDRSVIDNILENQASLMRSARIVPEQKDGKTVGIRLFGIRSDTLLGALGMQNGDRLEKINGFDVASPEKALEAYARLRTAPKISAEVNRRGKPLTIDINIK